MSSNVFVCSTKQKLVNFNDYLQKRRRSSLKARKSGRHCLLNVKHLENLSSSRMSLSNQTVKYSSNLPSHNLIPVPKIKTQTENERRKVELLLTPSHQQIFATSSHEHVIKQRHKLKAKSVPSKNGIDSKKTNQPWLGPFLMKTKLLGKHDTDSVNFTSLKIQPSKNGTTVVKNRISKIENPQLKLQEVPNLQNLFAKNQNSVFVKRPKRKFRVLSKIRCTSDNKVICPKKAANSSQNNKQADKDQQANTFNYASYLNSCLQAVFERQSNLNLLRSINSPSKKKQRNEFFEDPEVVPLLSKKLFRPCKTGCVFLRSNRSPESNMKNDDLYNELFAITQEIKGELQSTSSRTDCSSEHADDCDSGYRSKGDSKDEDGIQQAKQTIPFGCYCVRCSAMYYSKCAGGYNNRNTLSLSTESIVCTNPARSKLSFSNCFNDFWSEDNLVSHVDNNWLDNLLDEVNTS